MTNTVTIVVDDEGIMDIKSSEPMTYEDILSMTMTLCLSAMRQVVSSVSEDCKAEAKGALYDTFNVTASELLELFAPEFELRPNLTAQAILEAENAIVMRGDLDKIERGS